MDISDDEVFRAIATNRFRSEFNGQINSVFGEEPGKVELQIKDASTVFSVASDEVTRWRRCTIGGFCDSGRIIWTTRS